MTDLTSERMQRLVNPYGDAALHQDSTTRTGSIDWPNATATATTQTKNHRPSPVCIKDP